MVLIVELASPCRSATHQFASVVQVPFGPLRSHPFPLTICLVSRLTVFCGHSSADCTRAPLSSRQPLSSRGQLVSQNAPWTFNMSSFCLFVQLLPNNVSLICLCKPKAPRSQDFTCWFLHFLTLPSPLPAVVPDPEWRPVGPSCVNKREGLKACPWVPPSSLGWCHMWADAKWKLVNDRDRSRNMTSSDLSSTWKWVLPDTSSLIPGFLPDTLRIGSAIKSLLLSHVFKECPQWALPFVKQTSTQLSV